MKFVLCVEGDTERRVLPGLLRKWLDERLSQAVGIQVVAFKGWADFEKGIVKKVHTHLSAPNTRNVIAAIGLLDLYGPTFYPPSLKTPDERRDWAVKKFEKDVDDPRFRMFFAVHELEAWLLSDLNILPASVAKALQGKAAKPEAVNFDAPPAKLLDEIYRKELKRSYKKTTDGVGLFGQLAPDRVYEKCPHFKEMVDTMLQLAQAKCA